MPRRKPCHIFFPSPKKEEKNTHGAKLCGPADCGCWSAEHLAASASAAPPELLSTLLASRRKPKLRKLRAGVPSRVAILAWTPLEGTKLSKPQLRKEKPNPSLHFFHGVGRLHLHAKDGSSLFKICAMEKSQGRGPQHSPGPSTGLQLQNNLGRRSHKQLERPKLSVMDMEPTAWCR